jgi:CRISPR/Cas system-associated exonuclease Cas4 (RecB family)
LNPFLSDIAKKIYATNPRLDEVTVIFPNRRAILYFRKYLSVLLTKPTFAPRLLTIEEFVAGFSLLTVPDKLELVHRLYRTYSQTVTLQESFDKFYFWGEMLLRDFDEVDKYLVDAAMLFRDLSQQKELDASFDYLDEEQKKFLLDFWGHFEERTSEHKQKFLEVWQHLGAIYQAYREQLRNENLAYEGMLHRDVAQNLPGVSGNTFRFVGFNALTKAEELIISHFVEQGAEVYWDLDEYYVNNKDQEAGEFFREYQEHVVLKKTFDSAVPANFRSPKSFHMYGAAQPVGQAKVMAQVLEEQLASGASPEDILIVLPDEKLMLPVLHGVSDKVEKLNITMGFPLSSTPMFNLVESLIELQLTRKQGNFNHRPVLALLNHPYGFGADPSLANARRKEILKHNWVSIPKNFLANGTELYRLIFTEADTDTIVDYLRNIISCIGSLQTLAEFDKEYAFHFLKSINRIGEVLGNQYTDLASFLRFFRQYIRSQKIPFSGEPLQGLQVMGMLETRNLDFKNVYLLSLNEGSLPPGGGKGSYIPYNIRKAYRLPTVEHQDAMYAYLFYRIIQRAENVFLFYNTETDILGRGEMSRFLQQLLYEGGINTEPKTLNNPIRIQPVEPIVIQKDKHIVEALAKLNEGNSYFKGISPSALNAYIECRLRFFFRHVMKIKEADEVEEDMDARVLGNFLHDVMDTFYRELAERKSSKQVEVVDLINAEAIMDDLLDKRVIKEYHLDPDKPVAYEGQLLIVREVVKRFISRILERDRKQAPFVMEGVEAKLEYTLPVGMPPGNVVLGGKIDRVDVKDGVLRIVDYKTGKDKLDFESVESLFVRDGKDRNKAAFQTLLYAWLYVKCLNPPDGPVVPGLLSSKIIFDDEKEFGLKMNKQLITDVRPHLPEFEARLRELLEELFNPEQPFDQTTNTENCKYCPYKRICYR